MSSSRLTLLVLTLVSATAAWTMQSTPAVAADRLAHGHIIEFDGFPHESVVDPVGERIYVSVASSLSSPDEIVAISLTDHRIADRQSVGPQPRGIALSPDGEYVSVALYGSATVARWSIPSGTVTEIPLKDTLYDDGTWDVIEPVNGILFVSAYPETWSSAFIVRADVASGESQRVAYDRQITSHPGFVGNSEHVYVNEGYSGLHKLTVDDGALLASNYQLDGTRRLALAPDGRYIVTGAGQRIATDELRLVGVYGEGHPAYSEDGSRVYMARYVDDPSRGDRYAVVDVFDADTTEKLEEIRTTCTARSNVFDDFEVLPGADRFAFVSGHSVCITSAVEPMPACGGYEPTIFGTDGDDVLTGTDVTDVIVGLGGADRIEGLAGDDVVCGGTGNDVILGGSGDDDLFGGSGLDTVSYSGADGPVAVDLWSETASGEGGDLIWGFENIVGSRYADELFGDNDANIIDGGRGSDLLDGVGGDDVLRGGGGHDVMAGGSGHDVLRGGSGEDDLLGEAGNDDLHGNRRNDRLAGGPGDDLIRGGRGTDLVDFSRSSAPVVVDLALGTSSGEGDDVLTGVWGVIGSRYDDVLMGNARMNYLEGGRGQDLLRGRAHGDTFLGGPGDDRIVGGRGWDLVSFEDATRGVTVDLREGFARGRGRDTLKGISSVIGSVNDDVLYGNRRGNGMSGLAGNDAIRGRGGDDVIHGGRGRDLLVGGGGFDDLRGGPGRDELRGNRGRDRLDGGSGRDLLKGGRDHDTCINGTWYRSCEKRH